MAAAIARRELDELGWEGVEVRSAGVAAGVGMPASEGALAAARRNGLDLSEHRSTPLTGELVDEADLILVMSPAHAARVEALGGEGRVSLLGAFAEGREDTGEGAPVPDPFGGDDEVYETTFKALDGLIRSSLLRLEPMLAP